MPTIEHLAGQWREWRHARVSELGRPYGWTSLVAQYWLTDGQQGAVFELLPGTWGVVAGAVVYTPPAEGPNLSVDGEYPTAPIEIRPGRNQTSGHGTSVPVYFGELEVETLARTSDHGESLYAVRVRDPRASASTDLSGLTTFDYDPAWRIPASFTPTERHDIEAPTVETGVRETTARIGTLRFEHGGASYELAIIGKDAAYGVQPVAHIRDLTSGATTYGAGRVIELQFADRDTQRIDHIDFNYATPLPCAFTNFVTCPLPPRENHLDFEVFAGEQRPAVDVARVLTYSAPSGA